MNQHFTPQKSGPSYFTLVPLVRYRLGIEQNPDRKHRGRIAGLAFLLGTVAALVAWRDIAGHLIGVGLPIGIGRLVSLMAAQDWPFVWALAALEYIHYAILFWLMAAAAWFGGIQQPHPLPNEMIIFHRRQSRWVAANRIAPGLVVLAMTLAIGRGILAWLVVPVEMITVSALCLGGWLALVPEARMSVTVFLDGNAGWANRVVISGGARRLTGRLNISKDRLLWTDLHDIGGLEFLVGARSLTFQYKDADGQRQKLRVPGISRDPEISVLWAVLETRLKIALSPETLADSTRFNRMPVEAVFTMQPHS